MAMSTPEADPPVVWHELECGAYEADLPLWRELASGAARVGAHASVLDIGAGSGRVALDLARAGHRVTALDLSAELLEALREQAGELPVQTVRADARGFRLDGPAFDLCLMPMQTIQLLRGAEQRRLLFAAARAHMRAGALLACALVSDVEPFDSVEGGLGPSPERVRIDGTLYLSRAIRVALDERFIRIERERLVVPTAATSRQPLQRDVVELERVTPQQLWEEARSVGLSPEPTRTIAETADHAGSEVVMLRA
jgi:SAM-dependent methyltransferase